MTDKKVKPMLAVAAPTEVSFPKFASAKIDGVRAIIKDSMVLSRSLKPIPNNYISDILGLPQLNGLDGELTVGPPNAPDVMQRTTSGVMSRDGEPDFTFWIFDFWNNPEMPFGERWNIMLQASVHGGALDAHPRIKLLSQKVVHDSSELTAFERQTVDLGFEGIMLRDPLGRYKYGRSTVREGYLLKVKRWADDEAVVIGAHELMHNANEQTRNELGYAERSSAKDGLIAGGVLGALAVRDLVTGIEFDIGSGFDASTRADLWQKHLAGQLVGNIVRYKHFAVTGVKDKPRFPIYRVFHGFRNQNDMGE